MQAAQGAAARTLQTGYHAKGARRITGSSRGIEKIKVGRSQGQRTPNGRHFQTLVEFLLDKH